MDDNVNPTTPEGRERKIEKAIMDHPEELGFPGANSIRTLRVSPDSGLVDIALFPKNDPNHLVLVEAKAWNAHDAASKVIGQLLMYYAGALMLGSDGLSAMRKFAEDRDLARSIIKISHYKLTGISPAEKAWDALTKGTRLEPKQVSMFIALDGNPRHALKPTLTTLHQRHHLSIGLVVVTDGEITEVWQPPAG